MGYWAVITIWALVFAKSHVCKASDDSIDLSSTYPREKQDYIGKYAEPPPAQFSNNFQSQGGALSPLLAPPGVAVGTEPSAPVVASTPSPKIATPPVPLKFVPAIETTSRPFAAQTPTFGFNQSPQVRLTSSAFGGGRPNSVQGSGSSGSYSVASNGVSTVSRGQGPTSGGLGATQFAQASQVQAPARPYAGVPAAGPYNQQANVGLGPPQQTHVGSAHSVSPQLPHHGSTAHSASPQLPHHGSTAHSASPQLPHHGSPAHSTSSQLSQGFAHSPASPQLSHGSVQQHGFASAQHGGFTHEQTPSAASGSSNPYVFEANPNAQAASLIQQSPLEATFGHEETTGLSSTHAQQPQHTQDSYSGQEHSQNAVFAEQQQQPEEPQYQYQSPGSYQQAQSHSGNPVDQFYSASPVQQGNSIGSLPQPQSYDINPAAPVQIAFVEEVNSGFQYGVQAENPSYLAANVNQGNLQQQLPVSFQTSSLHEAQPAYQSLQQQQQQQQQYAPETNNQFSGTNSYSLPSQTAQVSNYNAPGPSNVGIRPSSQSLVRPVNPRPENTFAAPVSPFYIPPVQSTTAKPREEAVPAPAYLPPGSYGLSGGY